MDNTKLNRILDDLRTDVNDLLTKSYATSEVSLDALQDQLSTLSTNFYSLESEMTNLVASINTNAENITALTQQSENTQTRLDELQTNHTTFTEMFATHLLDFSTYAQKVDNQQKICHQTQQTALDNFNALKEFFEVFLTETEINSATTNVERITALKTYFANLKTHLATYSSDYFNSLTEQITTLETTLNTLQNSYQTLSQTVSTLSNSVNSLTPRVQTLEDNCQSMQHSINTLTTQVAKYLTPPDPYYIGKSFTDYPAGTIWQTYDCDERLFDIQNTKIITTPTLYFTTETASTGTIKLTQKFSVTDAVTLTIKVYLNQTLFSEQTFSTQAGTLHTYEFELFDCNFNQETTANNIYTTFTYTGSGKTISLSYQKVEITAPNARFLNKICPFNAYHFGGMYYLTDCTGGTLKTAQIEASEMHNMDNLEWVDTQIPAVECVSIATFTQNSDYTYSLQRINHLYRSTNYKWYIKELDYELLNIKDLDVFSKFSDSIYFLIKRTINTTTYSSVYIQASGYTTDITGNINDLDCVTYITSRAHYNEEARSMISMAVRLDDQARCTLGTFDNKTGRENLVSGINGTLLMYEINKNSSGNCKVNYYTKHIDKIIKQTIKITDSKSFEILSTIEFGYYDKVFEMPNNKYFVIRNKKMSFCELPPPEDTTNE